MKFVMILLGALAMFAVGMVGILAATGNLNQDAIDRLMGKEVESDAHGAEGHGEEGAHGEGAATNPDPITRQIQKQREDLATREAAVKAQEEQLNQRKSELDALYEQIQQAKSEFESTVSESEERRQVEIETVANTVSNMAPKKAAESLESMPIPDVVQVLRKVKDKDRGKIVEAMKPELAAEVLRKMQEPPLIAAKPTEGEG